ncbi:MAG TPA: restriction endonuclease [Methylocella sp.]|nr:restriction endonuclease [Methylocella sp.]
MARAAERAARERDRERIRLGKEQERQARSEEQIEKQHYRDLRIAETEQANAQLDEQLEQLRTILFHGLSRDPSINFENFLKYPEESELDSDQTLRLFPKPERDSFLPRKPTFFTRLIPGVNKRYLASIVAAEQCFSQRLEEFEEINRRRCNAMAALCASAEEHNRSVKVAETALTNNDPEAIRNYFELVLSTSEYPGNFPRKARVAYVPESKLLAFDYQLPTIEDIIPCVEKYKYVKATDELSEIKKSERTRRILYANVIAQTALRYLHEIFATDKLKRIDVVALNAYVDTIDASTGRAVQPCIISVRTTRDEFGGLKLRNVEPISCLKRLSASISRSPSELVAVKPIIDINMVDPRFIKEQDVLSTLDNRPNLMELSPGEFESLITNLFQKMGLDTKLTQASRDGGVDCVAFDSRPILGGKVVIQAKRYKNTVGVSSVRDLFGTMHNEGASKGILVTTSGYGKAAYDFANGKPIELITGSNLLYLLKEHASIEAKIEVPDDWVDSRPDASE